MQAMLYFATFQRMPLWVRNGDDRAVPNVRYFPESRHSLMRCHLRFVPILLQKSSITVRRGLRDLLELAAYDRLPKRGMV